MECRICDIEMLTRVMRRRGRSTLVGRQFAANYHLVEIAPPSSYCRPHNLKQDDIEYAIENTQVILAPERQIATFGNTSFEFHLISELMDRVDQVRIRTGRIEAERPKILSPEYFCRMMLEGFGEKAQKYVDRLREHAQQIAVLRYGFQFRKSGVTQETVSASLQSVIDRTRRVVENASDPNGAIIQGVDEAWEVCLLKFTIEMIERSAGENIGDFKRRGLI